MSSEGRLVDDFIGFISIRNGVTNVKLSLINASSRGSDSDELAFGFGTFKAIL